ncbi:SLBB domain-containing protein [bacterium]|nr:SLBB domain-containing protein [bacterium]
MKKIFTILMLLAFMFEQTAVMAATNGLAGNKHKNQDTIFLEDADAFEDNNQNLSINSGLSYLSKIEQMYNDSNSLNNAKALMQVGYDYFVAPVVGTSSHSGKFDDSYRFSIGEKVSANLYGDSVDVMAITGSNLLKPVVQAEVDSKGDIFIPGIGVVKAENKTIKEVETLMNQKANAKYKSLKIKLNVASGQDFSVFVYGQVKKPGKVIINNNSSIMDALGAAGGVKKTGTLRKISYTSGKKTREVDLYNTLFAGNDDDIILRPNDKIFVGGIGKVVAIRNGVATPGIYEIKDHESLKDIANFAGGLLPGTQSTEVTLTSLDTKTLQRTAKNVSWVEASRTKLTNGDSVEFRDIYNVAENTVVIQGNIKHPATYAYKPGMRLSDVLKDENELLEETFITQAVIRRISGKDNTIETIPIFLKEFFAGVNDPILQPRDVINIYKNTNSQFVDVYGAISMPKHIVYTDGMRLDDVLTEVQFVDSKINEQQENDKKDENVQNVSLKTQNGTTTALIGNARTDSRVISAENIACEITSEDGTTQVYYLYDIMITSNRIKSIKLLPNDKVFFRTLRDNEFIKNVKVSGFVNKPGVFKFVEGKRLDDLIKMADGLTDEADLRGIIYTRRSIKSKQIDLAKKNADRDIKLIEGRMASAYKASDKELAARADMVSMLKDEEKTLGQKYEGQIALNIKTQDINKIRKIDNISVQDGDEIYIPRMSKHVSVLGEVYNEQSFMYKSKRAGRYIREVGGYTPNASRFRKYKVGVNGRAEKIRLFSKIEPGDTIVVPRKVAGNDWYTPILSVFATLANLAVMGVAISKW